MTIKGQGTVGRIRLFNDFFGGEEGLDAETKVVIDAADFKLVGDGIAATDTQQTLLETDALSGVLQLETDNTDGFTAALTTAVGFDVGLMGTLVLEARIRMAALTTRVMFVGFSDVNGDDVDIEDDLFDVTAVTTIENTASDMCGFYIQSEMTSATELHAVYNGGATSASTDTTDNDLGVVMVAGEFMVLRLEIDNNGTARWYADEDLLKTLEGAISTTTDLAAFCGLGAVGATQPTMDVDYLLVEANRDWNA
jgi:hypothetical protein